MLTAFSVSSFVFLSISIILSRGRSVISLKIVCVTAGFVSKSRRAAAYALFSVNFVRELKYSAKERSESLMAK